MPQSTLIIVTLLVMFVVFVTLRGELDDYLVALGFRSAPTASK